MGSADMPATVNRRGFLGSLGATALAMTWPGRAAAEGDLVLSNARLLLGDGTEARGGVRIRGGRFVEVGPGVTGGTDLGGGVLYPGIYDGGSPLGLFEVDLEAGTHDEAESSEAITPQARVIDGYNPMSEVIPVQRSGGVLGGLVIPSGASLVPGQAAWVHTGPVTTVAAATLKTPAGLCFSLGHGAIGGVGGSPKSRMGVAMKLRDLFDANAPPAEPTTTKRAKKRPTSEKEPSTAAQKALHAVLRREMKAIFYADRADDLMAAIDLTRTYHLDSVLLGAAEGHLVAAALAEADIPLLLGPITTQPDSFDHLHARYENAALLHAAGVRFGLRMGDIHRLRDGTTEAGIAVAYGLPYGAAIAALSGNGPSFWGLDVGMLRVGHRASCVWTDGDPLQPRTVVRGLWMDGVAVPIVDRQTRLFERFRVLR